MDLAHCNSDLLKGIPASSLQNCSVQAIERHSKPTDIFPISFLPIIMEVSLIDALVDPIV